MQPPVPSYPSSERSTPSALDPRKYATVRARRRRRKYRALLTLLPLSLRGLTIYARKNVKWLSLRSFTTYARKSMKRLTARARLVPDRARFRHVDFATWLATFSNRCIALLPTTACTLALVITAALGAELLPTWLKTFYRAHNRAVLTRDIAADTPPPYAELEFDALLSPALSHSMGYSFFPNHPSRFLDHFDDLLVHGSVGTALGELRIYSLENRSNAYSLSVVMDILEDRLLKAADDFMLRYQYGRAKFFIDYMVELLVALDLEPGDYDDLASRVFISRILIDATINSPDGIADFDVQTLSSHVLQGDYSKIERFAEDAYPNSSPRSLDIDTYFHALNLFQRKAYSAASDMALTVAKRTTHGLLSSLAYLLYARIKTHALLEQFACGNMALDTRQSVSNVRGAIKFPNIASDIDYYLRWIDSIGYQKNADCAEDVR